MDQRRPPDSVMKYINYLRNKYSDVSKVYMFGSHSKGVADEDSDIDIAVIFNDFEDAFDLQVELMKLRRKFDSRIEPHVFRNKDFDISHPLVEEIMTKGIEIQFR